MTKENISYEGFVRLHETDSCIEANEYLEHGWVLLNVVKTQVAKESWTTYYIVGWNKSIDNIKYGRPYGERLRQEFKEKFPNSFDTDSVFRD